MPNNEANSLKISSPILNSNKSEFCTNKIYFLLLTTTFSHYRQQIFIFDPEHLMKYFSQKCDIDVKQPLHFVDNKKVQRDFSD